MSKYLPCPVGLLGLLLTLTACNAFDVHPYDVDFHGAGQLNAAAIATVERLTAGADTVRVAFISDTHGWYKQTRDMVKDLNSRTDIDFVVHCGDLTDTGTAKEYEWSRDILNGIRWPWLALIGNHDFLGTGDQTYRNMYGPLDFSFVAGRVKFVCLNTNATEYDYMAAVPNFDYLEAEMQPDTSRYDRTILVMHAPPYSDQFNNNVCKAFRRYLDYMPGLLCCIYGHNHTNRAYDIYEDGLMFYGVDCAEHRNYLLLTITPDDYEETLVYY